MADPAEASEVRAASADPAVEAEVRADLAADLEVEAADPVVPVDLEEDLPVEGAGKRVRTRVLEARLVMLREEALTNPAEDTTRTLDPGKADVDKEDLADRAGVDKEDLADRADADKGVLADREEEGRATLEARAVSADPADSGGNEAVGDSRCSPALSQPAKSSLRRR